MHFINALNQGFGIAGCLQFEAGPGGLPVATIGTAQASAQVALQGAHLLSWQPAGQQPVLWLSSAAEFAPGKPVRGGVPVCWPWFGPLADKGQHGFARNRPWSVRASALDAEGRVVLCLGLGADGQTRALWDHDFDLELQLTLGQTLEMTLRTRNTGAAAFDITQALHTYFRVGDIGQTRVLGLAGCDYLDKTQAMARLTQHGDLGFGGETDRVYLDTAGDCLIDDPVLRRRIRIAKAGSRSTVVWNPWADKVMADMAPGEYAGMVCVETCNAGPDAVTLAPGQTHALSARIALD